MVGSYLHQSLADVRMTMQLSEQSMRSLKAGQLQRVEVKHVSRIPMVLFQGLG